MYTVPGLSACLVPPRPWLHGQSTSLISLWVGFLPFLVSIGTVEKHSHSPVPVEAIRVRMNSCMVKKKKVNWPEGNTLKPNKSPFHFLIDLNHMKQQQHSSRSFKRPRLKKPFKPVIRKPSFVSYEMDNSRTIIWTLETFSCLCCCVYLCDRAVITFLPWYVFALAFGSDPDLLIPRPGIKV